VPTLTGTRMIRLLLFATLLPLAGCFSLSRNAPPPLHYVLGPAGTPGQASPGADPQDAAPGASFVGVRPARLADYLASPFIVVRRGAHQVEFSEYHRWGEDLGRAINRSVALRLAAGPPPRRVEAAPWPAGTSPDRVIQLHVLRFEGVVGATSTGAPEPGGRTPIPEGALGEAHLLATWEVLRPMDGAVLARGTTEVREGGWAVGDFDGLVRFLDRALDILADDLVRGLERVPADPVSTGAPLLSVPPLTPSR